MAEEYRYSGTPPSSRLLAGTSKRKGGLEYSGRILAGLLLLLAGTSAGAQSSGDLSELDTGDAVYREACAACHGTDGSGAPQTQVGFATPLPDFTDCSFASREPNADWVAVSHQGGPVRAFSPLMPAFGQALSEAQLESAIDYIRGFCLSDDWPRGEFNLPRPLVTSKAYLEDETVITSTINTESDRPDAFMNELVYEKRFGARNQFEVAIPFGWRDVPGSGIDGNSDRRAGIGDVVVGLKRALYDNLDNGAMVSVAGELVLPTGDYQNGFSKDTAVFEPMLMYGQLLPENFFLQSQAGLELPADTDKASEEGFLRATLGRTFTQNTWGRVWSPMVEVLGARELGSGSKTHWDIVPQVQVSLSRRQHILLNVGMRVPLNDTAERDTQFMIYLLWDWFDGGLTEGWQ